MLVRICSRHATPVELLVRAVFEFELARWGARWCLLSSLSLFSLCFSGSRGVKY